MTFVGSTAGDPENVAREFRKWLGGRRVLFPVSRQSAGTISNAIPDEQKEIIVCYETQLVRTRIAPYDVYVFTSPSNVDAFLQENQLPPSGIVVAWGKTTEKKFVNKGLKPAFVLTESTEEELVRYLETGV